MCQINLFKNEQKTTNYCRYFTLNINYEMEYNYGIIDYIKIQLLSKWKIQTQFKRNINIYTCYKHKHVQLSFAFEFFLWHHPLVGYTLFHCQTEECSHLFRSLKQEGPFLFYTLKCASPEPLFIFNHDLKDEIFTQQDFYVK